MANSILDPHAPEILRRVRQGYTQHMLMLYLQDQKTLSISQPSLSRWLKGHDTRRLLDVEPDAEFDHYQALDRLRKPARAYRRKLAEWRGLIHHLRERNASLGEILDDLKRRGVHTSIRTIRRELDTR
ncbi:hypothetical protein E8F11_10480 [Pseudomonas sp. BN417]|uniref:hypothetical protein n=1 Tax=Pseudomonas sp. BN417 TaxID=2567890 RepID=UPI002453B05D|nr:hypothetical protein [Pseudomonas sp. BN417]MDH4555598.1 hypothetical protein [Pseudomonas sp. BN417]